MRISSADKTEVLPFFPLCLGPRTEWAGFTGMTWPVTSQRVRGPEVLDVGRNMDGLDGPSMRSGAPRIPNGDEVCLPCISVTYVRGEEVPEPPSCIARAQKKCRSIFPEPVPNHPRRRLGGRNEV